MDYDVGSTALNILKIIQQYSEFYGELYSI